MTRTILEPALPAALVGRLRATFDRGTTRPLDWRLDQLARLRALLVDGEVELLDALHADLGKPRVEGWATDIGIVVNAVDHTRRHLRRWMLEERVWTPLAQRPGQARIARGPLGVVLVIAPWNYPVHLLRWPMLGAIAAGNCVIGKPSELTPHTSAAIAELVARFLDPAAVAIVEGGPDATQALLAECFDHIFYTGSGHVGHATVPGLPFGGVGASGTGAYHGRATFETFTHRRAVLRRRSRPDPSVAYPPYSQWKERLIRRFL